MKYIDPSEDTFDSAYDNSYNELKEIKRQIASLETCVGALQTGISALSSEVENLEDTSIASMQLGLNSVATTLNQIKGLFNGDFTAEDINTLNAGTVNSPIINANTVLYGKKITSPEVVVSNTEGTATLEANNATIESLESTTAELTNLTASLVEITENLTVNDVTAGSVSAENLTVDTYNIDTAAISELTVSTLATIESLNATVAKIATIKNTLLTVSDTDEWIVPGFLPDNTHLTKVTIPDYRGLINFVTQNGKIAITIFNNSYITYSQANIYFYHVAFNSSSVELYFANSGLDINFKLLFMGDAETVTDRITISMVDMGHVGDNHNISNTKGAISVTPVTSAEAAQVTMQYLSELPNVGSEKCIYLVESSLGDVQSYTWLPTELRFVPLSLVKETTTLDFVTNFQDSEAESTYTGSEIKFATSRNVYNSVKLLADAVKAAIKNIGNLADNIVYNSVDTYDRADPDTGVTSLVTYPDPTGTGIFILLVKQDETQGVRYVDEQGNNVYYSTIYLWQTSVATPHWSLVGKLNVSERMLEGSVKNAIKKALYRTNDTTGVTTTVSNFILRTENQPIKSVLFDNGRNFYMSDPVLHGTKVCYVGYNADSDSYTFYDTTGADITSQINGMFCNDGDHVIDGNFVMLGTNRIYTFRELGSLMYQYGYTGVESVVTLVNYRYTDTTTLKDYFDSKETTIEYVASLPTKPSNYKFYVVQTLIS